MAIFILVNIYQYNLGSTTFLFPTGNKIVFFLEIKMKFNEKSWNTKTILFPKQYYIHTNIFGIKFVNELEIKFFIKNKIKKINKKIEMYILRRNYFIIP